MVPLVKFQLLAQYTRAQEGGLPRLHFPFLPSQQGEQPSATLGRPPVSCLCTFFLALGIPAASDALSEAPAAVRREQLPDRRAQYVPGPLRSPVHSLLPLLSPRPQEACAKDSLFTAEETESDT